MTDTHTLGVSTPQAAADSMVTGMTVIVLDCVYLRLSFFGAEVYKNLYKFHSVKFL